MLTIRMRRVGAKKQPYFRVVVTEARSARDGRSLEVLGHYNPTAQPETLVLNRPRLRHWLDRGAQSSDTVRTLLSRHPAEPTETTEPIAATEPDDAAGATPVEAGGDQAES
jgi:small subunit ribosomal protein S16